jgi:hypothetical protein
MCANCCAHGLRLFFVVSAWPGRTHWCGPSCLAAGPVRGSRRTPLPLPQSCCPAGTLRASAWHLAPGGSAGACLVRLKPTNPLAPVLLLFHRLGVGLCSPLCRCLALPCKRKLSPPSRTCYPSILACPPPCRRVRLGSWAELRTEARLLIVHSAARIALDDPVRTTLRCGGLRPGGPGANPHPPPSGAGA